MLCYFLLYSKVNQLYVFLRHPEIYKHLHVLNGTRASTCYLCPVTRRRQRHPTPVLLPGKSHGWRSLVGCGPWGREEPDMTERLHFHFSLSRIGEGNGSPLQCSCLENPRDGGAWWAEVYGVAQSRTRLKRLNSSSSSPVTQNWKRGSEELKRYSQIKYPSFHQLRVQKHFLSLPLSVDQKLSKSLEVHRGGSAGNQPVLYKQSLPCPCPRGRINQMVLSVLQ